MNYDSIKSQVESMWLQPWELYKEKVAIFKTPLEVQVASGPSYNFFYGENSPNSSVNYIVQSGMFWAIVEYIDTVKQLKLNDVPLDNPAKNYKGWTRLTVDQDGKNFMGELEKVVLDGNNFRIVSDTVNRGPFSQRVQFDYYLEKIEP